MSRLDWKKGRFDVDFETNDMHRGLRGHTHVNGDEIDWYKFREEESEMHDIYDEGVDVGRSYDGPFKLAIWRAIPIEGPTSDLDTGFYFNNSIHITLSWEYLKRLGYSFMDIDHQAFLKDRLVYDNYAYRILSVNILGQIQRRDIVVSVEATQLKPDEMVRDSQFQRFTR